jgi:hypothetical protein
MDKKILLSGVAALLISGSMFATSASASAVSFGWEGEATLSAVFNDACSDSDVDTDSSSNAAVVADHAADSVHTSCLTGDSEDLPIWATSSELKWSASGTLANGLEISIGGGTSRAEDGDAITLSGAFGSISWEDGGDSAVKAALPNSDGDLDVSSRDGLGGHTLATSGTAGYVVNYQAPSMGGMDLYLSYAPSSNNSDLNDDAYLDTIAIGATMSAGDITIGAGWETATANTNAHADYENANGGANCVAGGTANLAHVASDEQGGQFCGDQTLMGIGASMNVGDLALNAGYTTLDTEEADKTTYNIGLETSVGAYTLGLDYVNSSLAYEADSTHDQTVIGASLSTALGDGVDLGLGFTSSSVDVAETGAQTNYRAEAKLTISY